MEINTPAVIGVIVIAVIGSLCYKKRPAVI